MTEKEIREIRASILISLRVSHLSQAFNQLRRLADEAASHDIHEELKSQFTAYALLLHYLMNGTDDPERENIHKRIKMALYRLTDKVTALLCTRNPTTLFFTRRGEYGDAPLSGYLDAYRQAQDKLSLAAADGNEAADVALLEQRERAECDIFNRVWTCFPISEADIGTVREILDTEADVAPNLKNLVVAALLLSLLSFYDEPKLLCLLTVYQQYDAQNAVTANEEHLRLALTALVYAMIAIYRNRSRCENSDKVPAMMRLLAESPRYTDDACAVYGCLTVTAAAEYASSEFRKKILPDLMQFMPDLIKKAQNNGGVIDLASIEENPKWRELIKTSGTAKHIEEFGKLQRNGSDVFLGTFSHLKQFPFFKSLYNWFQPFRLDCSHVATALRAMPGTAKDMAANAQYLCDNDKYSMLLSLSALPKKQCDILMRQLNVQNMQEGQLRTVTGSRAEVVTNICRNLYRFFKLSPRHGEFPDIFTTKLSFYQSVVLKDALYNADTLCMVAEIHLRNKQYQAAAEILDEVIKSFSGVNADYLQKCAFAHQCAGEYAQAVSYYTKYMLATDEDVWTLRQLALCHRALKQPSEAIACLHKALAAEPDNLGLTLLLGHCLLDMDEPAEALKQYFKVDYLEPGKQSAWRPIAWCSMITGNLPQSRHYYEKIFAEAKPDVQDELNYGHLCLCEHRFDDAFAHYQVVFASHGGDMTRFYDKMLPDIPALVKGGLSADTVFLLVDAMAMRLNGSAQVQK